MTVLLTWLINALRAPDHHLSRTVDSYSRSFGTALIIAVVLGLINTVPAPDASSCSRCR